MKVSFPIYWHIEQHLFIDIKGEDCTDTQLRLEGILWNGYKHNN